MATESLERDPLTKSRATGDPAMPPPITATSQKKTELGLLLLLFVLGLLFLFLFFFGSDVSVALLPVIDAIAIPVPADADATKPRSLRKDILVPNLNAVTMFRVGFEKASPLLLEKKDQRERGGEEGQQCEVFGYDIFVIKARKPKPKSKI